MEPKIGEIVETMREDVETTVRKLSALAEAFKAKEARMMMDASAMQKMRSAVNLELVTCYPTLQAL